MRPLLCAALLAVAAVTVHVAQPADIRIDLGGPALGTLRPSAFEGTARVIPDPALTPGTAATSDEQDVCSTEGGTYSQRHRLSQNERVKRQVLARYGVPWEDRDKYEDDHAVPLCAGGSDAVGNRWPQPRFGAWNAALKDRLEALACHQLCTAHKIQIDEAQGWFIAPADWRDAYCKHVLPEEADAPDPGCAELR